MKVNTQEIIDFIALYMQEKLPVALQEKLTAWLEADPDNRKFFERMTSCEHVRKKLSQKDTIDKEKAFRQFQSGTRRTRKTIARKIITYAAVFTLPVVISMLTILRQQEPTSTKISAATEITHGEAKAILTLAEGGRIELSPDHSPESLPTGLRLKNEKNELVYTSSPPSEEDNRYHALTTPKGGEYKITLPDGSFVHLNSNTTLKFPTRFDKDKREIYLSGEAYFEISKDKDRPFYVTTDVAKVKVHGTIFNINTLLNNQIQTTLLQGSIGIIIQGDAQEYFLIPSQQANIDYNTKAISIKDVNTVPFVAWKDGIFMFDDERLENIMEKLALWYNFNVFYQNEKVRNVRFTGYLKRYDNIDIILDAIETTVSVGFSIQGKNIIIYKNDYTEKKKEN